MKNKRTYIFVGAKEPKVLSGNPGGQLTASIGLKNYANSNFLDLIIVDTTQSSFPMPSMPTRLKKGVSRIFKVFFLLLKHKIDGIIIFSAHGFSFYERVIISLLGRIFFTKSIFFMRSGLFKDEMSNSKFKRKLAMILLKIPDIIAVQGDSWRPFFRNLLVKDSKILTIPNWLPSHLKVSKFPKVPSKDGIIKFCFVGWLVKEKGIVELLDAMNRVNNQSNLFEISIVGGGSLENYVKDFIKQNALQDVVNICGWCDDQQVYKILSESHVFVLPSHAEGFPNSLLEAMAFGLPAICTDVGAITDSLKDGVNGFIVSVGSSEDIAKNFLKYIKSPKLLTEHSKKSLEIVNHLHDKSDNCKRIFDVFHR